MKILIGSPIRQKSKILKEFLLALSNCEKGNNTFEYYFIDDNIDENSLKYLIDFSKNNKVIIKKGVDIYDACGHYDASSNGHFWDNDSVQKISKYKDTIIEYAILEKYDYLMLIDSDIVIDKRSILHLISRNVDIVSNIFWTQWENNQPLSPQCFWIPSFQERSDILFKQNIDSKSFQLHRNFISKLMVPGIYKVDGLGACTLISQNAMLSGVRFKEINNLASRGEDRHFCIRAGVLGFDLYLDTVYPAYHIYKEEYLDRVDEFNKFGFIFDMCQTYSKPNMKKSSNYLTKIKKQIRKITHKIYSKIKNKFYRIPKYNVKNRNERIVLQMIVKNECNRYLEKVINSVSSFVDYYVIIDDASEDKTYELCEKLLEKYPHSIIRNSKSLFNNEYILREQLWKETIKHNPGWILSIDADEEFQCGSNVIIRNLIKNNNIDMYYFKMFDMWNDTHYRDDEFWCVHKHYMPFLFRYTEDATYHWKKTNQHCGRFPMEVDYVKYAEIDLKVKHWGWSKEVDRVQKYHRYLINDPDGLYGNMKQYLSILDKKPNLMPYSENNEEFSIYETK